MMDMLLGSCTIYGCVLGSCTIYGCVLGKFKIINCFNYWLVGRTKGTWKERNISKKFKRKMREIRKRDFKC
jgi:hypothetical protein